MTEYSKVKSPPKTVRVRSKSLEQLVLNTMKQISAIVGSTLGPGGSAVLIERQDFGLPPLVTKDGVTVFQHLGYGDPTVHAIMESARDAAVRTVGEAGDGTSTCAVLSASIVESAQEYHNAHPEYPPQRIVEHLRDVFEDVLLPNVEQTSKSVTLENEDGCRMLRAVANISANGDGKLADAVMDCFQTVGDHGTVAISERSGPPGYLVEKVEGYPIPVGYEDSCARFMHVFTNDKANSRCFLTKPYFILFNGVITDMQALFALLERMQLAWDNRPGTDTHNPSLPSLTSPNVVLVANGFSEQVLATLAMNFPHGNIINVLPLTCPRSIIHNGEAHFLYDVAAITDSTVLDPLQRTFDQARVPGEVDASGLSTSDIGQVEEFEMLRFRSTIYGHADNELIEERAEILKGMIRFAISELDARVLQERLGALTGGIAKLWVIGSSQGELRERKDRADDAVRAVQGALKYGVLPGGGLILLRLAATLLARYGEDSPEYQVLGRALRAPVRLLLSNTGLPENEIDAIVGRMELTATTDKFDVWDAAERKWVDPYEGGILDSTPAVREAIRNSISIASLLGTLGGTIVFQRDQELERREAQETNAFLRDSAGSINPANERA